MALLKVYYSKTGKAIADHDLIKYCEEQFNLIKGTTNELRVDVSTEAIILTFRVLVARGTIKPSEIVFFHENDKAKIKLDKRGAFTNHPNNEFCAIYSDLLNELIQVMYSLPGPKKNKKK